MTDYELQMTRIKKLEVQPGIEIGYEELGTGDKYVLCTQMGFNEQFYARKFADHGYHVFLLWNRGSGPSSPATEDFGPGWYDVWADDVISFADKKGIDKFVYTGNSHGAGTGWHLLLRHQERVTAFIAFVPGPHNIEEGSSNLREIASKHPEINFLSDNWKDPAILKRRAGYEEYGEECRRHQLEMNYGRPLKKLGTEEKLKEALSTIKTPTLIVGGMEDMISRPDLMLRSAKALPNCKLIIYSGLGHSGPAQDITEDTVPECLFFLKNVAENPGKAYAKVLED